VYFASACTLAEPTACLRLAELEDAKNVAAVVTHYERACLAGASAGCMKLGQLLAQRTTNQPAGRRAAVGWFEHACNAGDPDACMEQGNLLTGGAGVTVDLTRALDRYERACRGGGAAPCKRAAEIHKQRGNAAVARERYKLACSRGDTESCALK
jgi:uncharacterized protein